MHRTADVHARSHSRLVELDFVRGLAIIAVMGIHFHTVDTGSRVIRLLEFPLKNFGREGVTLFFTLSGFLVGGLLLRQYAETGTVDAWRFFIRRIFKIWPAYYLLILVHALAGHHARNTFLLQNATHLQNYLGSAIAQTWSLAVEEHFYLLLPIALLLSARWRLTPGRLLWLLATACMLVLLARSAAVAGGDIRGAYVYTQYRVDSMLFGVMLAVLYWMKPGIYRKLAARRGWLAAAVAGLLAWLLFCQADIVVEESIGFTIQSIGFIALIVLVLEHSGRLRDSVAYRAVAWIGVYSYGIYLWHTVARAPGALVIHEALAHGLPPAMVWVLALVMQFTIAIAVGYLTTRAVEFPFLRLRDALFPVGPRGSANVLGKGQIGA